MVKTFCISLPGVKKPLGQYGPPGVADTTSASKSAAKDDDDDDIDLFGSDDEVRRLYRQKAGSGANTDSSSFRRMKRLPG